jgi:hypothetical protein
MLGAAASKAKDELLLEPLGATDDLRQRHRHGSQMHTQNGRHRFGIRKRNLDHAIQTA